MYKYFGNTKNNSAEYVRGNEDLYGTKPYCNFHNGKRRCNQSGALS